MPTELQTDWDKEFPESTKFQNTSFWSGSSMHGPYTKANLNECKDACAGDSKCKSITFKDGQCWMSGKFLQSKNSIDGLSSNVFDNIKTTQTQTGATTWYKHPVNVTTKVLTNKIRARWADASHSADVSEAGWSANGPIGDCYDNQIDLYYNCRSEKMCLSNDFSADGSQWAGADEGIGYTGCPRIGKIAGGTIDRITSCDLADGRDASDGNTYWGALDKTKGICQYQTIYNPTSKTAPTGSTALTFSELKDYFEDSQLDIAEQLWCRDAGTYASLKENINDCKGVGGFDYRAALADLLSNTWYTTTTGCDQLKDLALMMNIEATTNARTKFLEKLNKLPTTGDRWSSDVVRVLNTIFVDKQHAILGEIKDRISTLMIAYCNARPSGGKDEQQCACKNAHEGWETKSCTASKGCEQVAAWISVQNDLQNAGLAGRAEFLDFSTNFNAVRDSTVCEGARGRGNSETLAYAPYPEGAAKITQFCGLINSAIDEGKITFKGDVKIACDLNATSTVNTNKTINLDEGLTGDGDGGGATTSTTNTWLIVGIVASVISLLIVLLGGGGLLLFI